MYTSVRDSPNTVALPVAQPNARPRHRVWCEVGEHTYSAVKTGLPPPMACPACESRIPKGKELERQLAAEAARAKRLCATATGFQGAGGSSVCARCNDEIALPADNVPLCRACRRVHLPTHQSGLSIPAGSPFEVACEIGLRVTEQDIAWWERSSRTRHGVPEEVLWCEPGAHEWLCPQARGPRPKSCPEHIHLLQGHGEDWAGALPNCFLIDTVWATRLFVNAVLLRGARWRVPGPIAANLEISKPTRLAPARHALGQDLAVAPVATRLMAGSIGAALRALEAMEGDFVFAALSPDKYDLVPRKRRELRPGDDLGRLLWGCGIEPNDEGARGNPWAALSRALGGTIPNRQAVRQRLIERGNVELVEALDGIHFARSAGSAEETSWPAGWEFVSRLGDDTGWYSVVTAEGSARLALGVVADGSAVEGTIVDGADIAWVDAGQEPYHEVAERHRAAGIVHGNQAWAAWKRAEHHARRSALTGAEWRIVHMDGQWVAANAHHRDLRDALGAVSPDDQEPPQPPDRTIRLPCPRSAFAYERLVARAVARGLTAVEADSAAGFAAVFGEGTSVKGPALADIL